ncbi:MAG TPA: ABC transporter ATP-binding protein [Streptosporangiaceae bacterium]|nr:ABC transporter ATP-binding protein [Streptosporangiaceae bacterium]
MSLALGDPARPGWVRRLWAYVDQHRRELYLSLTGALIGGLCQTTIPLAERQIVDGVVVSHTSALWPWLLLMALLSLLGLAMSYLRRYNGGRVALGVQYDLRNAMHDHLQRMDTQTLNSMPTGQLVGRANSDSTLVQGLLNYLPIMSSNLLLVVLSLAVMLWLSPLLAVAGLVVVPVVTVLSYRMRSRVFPASWDAQQREGDVVQMVDECLNGVRVVKAFGQERRELQRVTGASQLLYGSQVREVRLQARFQPVLQAMPALGQVAILALGGWMALRHQISLGTFLAFSTYMAQLVSPAQRLANVITVAQQARAGVERIFQLLDLKPAIADRPGATELGRARGEVAFTGVRFGYDENEPVLDGFDLTVAAGERIALIGPSGCGKSTAVLLLSRFHEPQSGAVLVDGHDVRDLTLASLRHQVGMAFEDSFLFSTSVRDNIAYARPDAPLAEIVAAARAAGAHGFIEKLPRGYDTMVGERGLSLSGGQRQRVALARALLYDPAILVLDDATSAVDATTEEAIHGSLRELMDDRTTILIAHRRSTLHLADRIVVMDRGRVVDQGPHDVLMERSDLYRSLLTGLEEATAAAAGDRIEALATIGDGAITAAAWAKTGGSDIDRASNGAGHRNQQYVTRGGFGAPSLGMGLGGGSNWRANLAPTPEFLAQVAALPPVTDVAEIDLPAESRREPRFSLRRLMLEFRRPLGIGLVLVILDALAALAGPLLVKWGVDGGVRTGSESALFAASGIYLAVTLADMIDEIGETFVTGRAAQRIMLSLRIRIWAQLQRLSLDYYESEMAGKIMTRMTTDVDQFESLIENGALSALVSLVTFVGVGAALLAINLELGLCTLSVAVPLAISTVVFRRRAVVLYNQARDRIAIVNADFQESLSGVRESQAFVHEGPTAARFHRLGRAYLDSRVAAQRLVAIYFPWVQFLSGVASVIVLGVGAAMIHQGQLTAGALIAFVLYIDLFFTPIQQLSQVFDSWQQTTISVARIGELMRTETLTPNPDHPRPLGEVAGEVRFDGVHFAYPEPARERPGQARRGPKDSRAPVSGGPALAKPPEAIRGIDLRIAPGETVALVGETGAGKSTLVKLLARFYDVGSGRVTVDGYDVRELDLEQYRSRLGYVPQESFLFTGSVRDNIAYGRPAASDAEVEAAARAVGAHEFVAALPGGYRHQLAERGKSLSAGQRQLLALARAQLVDPAILLLDEATSNLDLMTEARVNAAMDQVSRGRTTIIIAHRLQTARAADRIVVLDSGQIVESGGHDALLAAGRRYAAMWESFETATTGAR